jgi:glycosyltransferase involved in cell wall biosynthesis
MHVVHVALGLEMGGMEKLLVEFARCADRERFVLHFVSLGTRGSLAADIEASGWQVTALNEPPGLRASLVFRLARLFRRWNVDVVHTHNTKPLIYGGPAARLAGVPGLIHTRHGQRFQARGRATTLFRLAACLADRIVCVSQDAATLSAREGNASKKLRTIWNGIDVSRFAYTGPKVDGPVVTVGRLSPEKDVETLILATAMAVRERPSFRLEVAGNGNCLPALKRITTEMGLTGHVQFLGEVWDIPGLLRRASLFVLPSLTEGISLTLLEAMATGLPVVATRVGGNPEVVIHGETGLLVDAGGPSELANAMLWLQRSPEEGRRMGSAGRRRAEQHFDVRRMVSEYEALYRELGSEKNGAADRGTALSRLNIPDRPFNRQADRTAAL